MDRKLIIGILIGVVVVTGSVGFSFYRKHEAESINQTASVPSTSKYVVGDNVAKTQENLLKQSSPANPVNKKGIVTSNNINGSNDYNSLPPTNLPNINDTKFPKNESSGSKGKTADFKKVSVEAFNKLYSNRTEPTVADSPQANILVIANQKTLDIANQYKDVIDKFVNSNNSVEAKNSLAKLDSETNNTIAVLNNLKSSFNDSNYASTCETIVQNLQSVQELSQEIYNKFTGELNSVSDYYQNLSNCIYVIQSTTVSISPNINYNKLSEWTQSNNS